MAFKRPNEANGDRQPAKDGKAAKMEAESEETKSSSIASRVAASASGLARDLVGAPGSAANATSSTSSFAQSMASSAASGSKSSASGPSAMSQAAQDALSGTKRATGVPASLGGSDSFRESRQSTENHAIQKQFEAFEASPNGKSETLYSGMSSFEAQPASTAILDERQVFAHALEQVEAIPLPTDNNTLAAEWRESFASTIPSRDKGKGKAPLFVKQTATSGPSHHSADVAAAEMQDGKAVSDILNDPLFGNDVADLEGQTRDLEEPSADDLFGLHTLPADQIESASKLRGLMPPPPSYRPKDSTSDANFVPSVALLKDAHGNLDSYLDQDGGELQRQWLDAWQQVLERYTDEVWGPDLPAVREAREEIKNLKKQPEQPGLGVNGSTNAALQRLRTILGHLKLPQEELGAVKRLRAAYTTTVVDSGTGD